MSNFSRRTKQGDSLYAALPHSAPDGKRCWVIAEDFVGYCYFRRVLRPEFGFFATEGGALSAVPSLEGMEGGSTCSLTSPAEPSKSFGSTVRRFTSL